MENFEKDAVVHGEFTRGPANLCLKDIAWGPGEVLELSRLESVYDGVRVQTRRPLARFTDTALTCAAYTAADYIEGFALDGITAAEVATMRVCNAGKFEIEYAFGDLRFGRPYVSASSWRLTPAVFTPQASIIVDLCGRRGASAPPAGLIIYEVFVRPERYDAVLCEPTSAPAILGDGGLRLAVGKEGYDILDDRGIRLNQF